MRLVVLYTVITSLALVGFSLTIYFAIQYQSYKSLELDLAKRASHVIEQIDFQGGKLVLPPSITRGSVIERRYEFIVDEAAEPFFKNPILGDKSVVLNRGDLKDVSTKPKVIDSTLNDETPVKLAVSQLKNIPGKAFFVTASPISEVEGNLDNLATTMVFANIVFIIFVFGIGYVFARGALRPVHEITSLAREISRGDLKKRVNLKGQEDELKELADTFDEMISRLEELFEDQKTFFQDVSHELRTPLTIIRGKLDVALRSKNASPEDYRKVLKDVLCESEVATRLVNDLLKVARGERISDELKKADFPADRLLVEIGARISVLGKHKGINVGISVPDDIPMINGDEERIGEALLAIGDNAIKHCGPGGSVTLALNAEAPWVVFRVADTGEGIPEKDVPHIFERFYKVDTPTVRESTGTGLGLAIAKQVVEAHNGRIEVQSSSDGTEFSVYLPSEA